MTGVRAIYDSLLQAYGPQRWWPADSSFEVIAGAVLVQRTTWENAALAVSALRSARCLDCHRLSGTTVAALEDIIRPAGFFRVKARRLKAVATAIASSGGIDGLAALDTARLRSFLLGVHGVGPETADSILLYAFERPVAVIDAYFRRIWTRLNNVGAQSFSVSDSELRNVSETAFPSHVELNELHALLVEHGKRHCRTKPVCAGCPLVEYCCASGFGSDAGRRLQ